PSALAIDLFQVDFEGPGLLAKIDEDGGASALFVEVAVAIAPRAADLIWNPKDAGLDADEIRNDDRGRLGFEIGVCVVVAQTKAKATSETDRAKSAIAEREHGDSGAGPHVEIKGQDGHRHVPLEAVFVAVDRGQ